MTDRQIRCFLALYETLNFSAAARQLFLTQPTLSYQIRTLEEELGTPLFTRTTCRVEPTEAGQLFAAFAQNVRQSYQAFQHALAAGPARREKLVLQVPLTMASRDLVYHDLLLALSQELPDCDLEVRTDTSCTSPEEVLQSGVDALVQMLLEPVSDAIDCLPLFDTKCHLLASPGSPLSACGTLTPWPGRPSALKAVTPYSCPWYGAAWRTFPCGGSWCPTLKRNTSGCWPENACS